MPSSQQVQQLGLPGGEPRHGVAAPLAVQVRPVQVRAQRYEHRPVPLAEVRPGPAEKEQPHGPAGLNDRGGPAGQRQHEIVFESQRPVDAAAGADGMPLPVGVEIRDLHDTAQVAGPVGVAALLAVPVMLPVHRRPRRTGESGRAGASAEHHRSGAGPAGCACRARGFVRDCDNFRCGG